MRTNTARKHQSQKGLTRMALLLAVIVLFLAVPSFAQVFLIDNNGYGNRQAVKCKGECYQIYKVIPPENNFRISTLNMEFKYREYAYDNLYESLDGFSLTDVEIGTVQEVVSWINVTNTIPCGITPNGTTAWCEDSELVKRTEEEISWSDFTPHDVDIDNGIYLKITGVLTGKKIDIVPVFQDIPYYEYGWLIRDAECDRRANFYLDYPSTTYENRTTTKLILNTSVWFNSSHINGSCAGLDITDSLNNSINFTIPYCNTAGETEAYLNSTTDGEGYVYWNCSPLLENYKEKIDWDDEMVLFYPFAQPSGTTAIDATWQYNGTIYDGGRLAESDKRLANNVLNCNGSSTYIETGYNSQLTNMTLSIWAYYTPGDNAEGRFIDKNGGGSTEHFYFALQTNEIVQFIARHSSGSTDIRCTTTAAQWNHIVATRVDGGNISMYINGEQCNTTTLGGTGLPVNSDTVTISRNSVVANGFFEGMLDNVQIFSDALNVSDVLALYHAGNRTLNQTTEEFQYPAVTPSYEFEGVTCGEKYARLWINFSFYGEDNITCILRDNEYLFQEYEDNCTIQNLNTTGFYGHNRFTVEYENHTIIDQCDVWLSEKELELSDYAYYFLYIFVIFGLLFVSYLFRIPALMFFAGIATIFMSFVFYTVSYLMTVVFILLGLLLIVISWSKFGTPSKVFSGR